jgi:hypothetical protein
MELIPKQCNSNKSYRMQYALLDLGINTFKGDSTLINKKLKVYKRSSFWQRNDLDFLFQDARKAYLTCAKLHHPDLNGSHEIMQRINQSWSYVRREFERRGYTLN